jgi:hypothetical protein
MADAYLPADYDRETQGFQLGTLLSTILYCPINFTAEIYGFSYVANQTGVGTIVAELLNQISGTITGTIDVVDVQPGTPVRDAYTVHAKARVKSGAYLVGRVVTPTGATGSLEGVLTYALVPGRLQSS